MQKLIWAGTAVLLALTAAAFTANPVVAQAANQSGDATLKEIERYRQTLADGNPAELWEARGEDLWKQKRGPNKVSFAGCDIGMGPGVVKGAYTVLPKYFEDSGKVEDLESRLVTCMVMQQGYSYAQATKGPFGGPDNKSDIEALVAYVTASSRGMKMNVSLKNPAEKEAYEIGRKMFFHRSGPHDFGCVTCHGADKQRIRLQELPNLLNPADAKQAYTSWPAYRVSQGELRTFQWRLNDCFRQQRFPELEFTSQGSIALTTFLAKNASGGVLSAPSIKR